MGHTATWTSRHAREAGFREAARECEAHVEFIEGGNDSSTAFSAVRHYLGARPKSAWPRALFASNEPLLNGSLRAFRALDVLVPSEIAVVGFDDFVWADLLEPPITTINQHIEEIGHMAGEDMLALLEEKPNSAIPRRLTVPTLCVRESCGCPVAASRTQPIPAANRR